jgi:hypothetical protein
MKPYLRYAFVIIVSMILLSCGGDNLGNDNVTVPEDGAISFLTDDLAISYPDTDAVWLPNTLIQIKAEDAVGDPVANAEITVSYAFAAPHTFDLTGCSWGPNEYGLSGSLTSTQVVMQFFDHNDDQKDQPLIVKTNEYGIAEFFADITAGCVGFGLGGLGINHSGTINAQSGQNVDTMEISVSTL